MMSTFFKNNLTFLLFLCIPTFAYADDQSVRLWNTEYKNTAVCSYKYGRPWAPIAPKNYETEIRGYKWPHAEGSAQQYVDFMQRDLNVAAVNASADQRIKQRLLKASGANSFSKLNFEQPGGPSPSFASALVALTSSFALDYLLEKGALNQNEFKIVTSWIKNLLRNSTKRSFSEDHRMQILTARLAYAVAINDTSGFRKQVSELEKKIKKLNQPYFVPDVRNNNEIIQHVVIASHIAEQNGIRVFHARFGRFSLAEVIAAHAVAMRGIKDKKIKTASDENEIARSIFRPQGNGAHLAWIPVFMAYSRQTSQGKEVEALHRDLRRSSGNPYWGLAMGIHSGCMFGSAAR